MSVVCNERNFSISAFGNADALTTNDAELAIIFERSPLSKG
jgi:hypothetical protein